MGLTSNQRRAQARQQCREALAAHICERLRLSIPPQCVRLQPSVEDGYAWSVLPGKEYLLDTNLGNGTVGRYQDIVQQLGSSLEAATPQRQQPKGTDHDTISREEPKPPEPGSASFTEMIRLLEHEKKALAVDLESARAQSEDLLCKDREWQEKTCCLQEELQGCQSSIDQLERELERGSRGIIAAITALQSSQSSKEDKISLQMDEKHPDTPSCR